jgi:hypothetical protein
VQALTINGGTPEQRATVRQAIESCALDYRLIDRLRGGVTVDITTAVLDGLEGQTFAWPQTDLRETLTGDRLALVAAHEWMHHLWFAMSGYWRMQWLMWVDDGTWDFDVWERDPTEHFAESMRVVLFPTPAGGGEVQTKLPAIDAGSCLMLINTWQTTLGAEAYRDIAWEDIELQQAVAHLRAKGIMSGYSDGTWRPYAPLLKRHIYLVCERAGLPVPGDWRTDYAPATRREVSKAIPGLVWKEARWSEGLTRSQLARLLLRAAEIHEGRG